MATPLRELTEPELRQFMDGLGDVVQCSLPAGTLFALLIFDHPRVVQYVGNANRADMIRAMREAASRLEAREDITR